jgi:hypothetical protein
MALAPFHLHVDNDEPRRLWLQLDFHFGHRRILRLLSSDYFMGVRELSIERNCSFVLAPYVAGLALRRVALCTRVDPATDIEVLKKPKAAKSIRCAGNPDRLTIREL